MKRTLVTFSIVALVLSVTTPAISAVKPGMNCKKAGQTTISNGKKFTCVKSGKKLVWNSGVKVKVSTLQTSPTPASSASPSARPSPAQTLSANPFQTPFPDEFTRTELVNAALLSFDSYVASNSSMKTYKLVVGKEFEKNNAEIRTFVDKSYSVLPFPNGYQNTIVVITNDRDFAEKEVSSFGFDRSDANKATGGPCMNCAGEGWSVSDNGLGPVVPHEIFHVWQKSAYKRKGNNNPDPNNSLNPPVWFDEGSAEFFGYAMYRERLSFYEGIGIYPAGKNLESLRKYSTRDLDRLLPYVLGRIASEYIVASVGMERFLQIFFNVGEGLDFPRAFEKATGITIDVFYEKFDKNIKKMF